MSSTQQLENAIAELNKLGYTSILDAIIKQNYQIKRLEGLLEEAYREIRRGQDRLDNVECEASRANNRLDTW